MKYYRQRTTQSETFKYKKIYKINVEIIIYNAVYKVVNNKNNKNIKQKRKSEQIWRYEKNKINIDYKINVQIYINNILFKKEKLYDFVEVTQARNSNRLIYFIENNVEVYAKVFATLKEKRYKRNIIKVNWIINSSDLHFIENIWLFLEKYLQFTFNNFESSFAASKQKAENIIRNAWYFEHIQFKAQKTI